MKKLLLTLSLALSFGIVALHAQQAPATPAAPAAPQNAANSNPNAPKFNFKAGETFDFGEINEGPLAEHQFEFTNTGKEPLIIMNASASCGCTTPEWPKEPIMPGKKAVITVKYNTQGRVGPFRKDIYIQSNAKTEAGKERYELHITGTVKAKAPEAPAAAPAKQ